MSEMGYKVDYSTDNDDDAEEKNVSCNPSASGLESSLSSDRSVSFGGKIRIRSNLTSMRNLFRAHCLEIVNNETDNKLSDVGCDTTKVCGGGDDNNMNANGGVDGFHIIIEENEAKDAL